MQQGNFATTFKLFPGVKHATNTAALPESNVQKARQPHWHSPCFCPLAKRSESLSLPPAFELSFPPLHASVCWTCSRPRFLTREYKHATHELSNNSCERPNNTCDRHAVAFIPPFPSLVHTVSYAAGSWSNCLLALLRLFPKLQRMCQGRRVRGYLRQCGRICPRRILDRGEKNKKLRRIHEREG